MGRMGGPPLDGPLFAPFIELKLKLVQRYSSQMEKIIKCRLKCDLLILQSHYFQWTRANGS